MSDKEPMPVDAHIPGGAASFATAMREHDEGWVMQDVPILKDGVLFVPSDGIQIALVGESEEQAEYLMIYMMVGAAGLCLKLSSVMARQISSGLAKAADLIEAHAAAQAAAALAKAQGGAA